MVAYYVWCRGIGGATCDLQYGVLRPLGCRAHCVCRPFVCCRRSRQERGSEFGEAMANTLRAQGVFLKTDASLRVRRALLRRQAARSQELVVGQRCFYLRNARACDSEIKLAWTCHGRAEGDQRARQGQGVLAVKWSIL